MNEGLIPSEARKVRQRPGILYPQGPQYGTGVNKYPLPHSKTRSRRFTAQVVPYVIVFTLASVAYFLFTINQPYSKNINQSKIVNVVNYNEKIVVSSWPLASEVQKSTLVTRRDAWVLSPTGCESVPLASFLDAIHPDFSKPSKHPFDSNSTSKLNFKSPEKPSPSLSFLSTNEHAFCSATDLLSWSLELLKYGRRFSKSASDSLSKIQSSLLRLHATAEFIASFDANGAEDAAMKSVENEWSFSPFFTFGRTSGGLQKQRLGCILPNGEFLPTIPRQMDSLRMPYGAAPSNYDRNEAAFDGTLDRGQVNGKKSKSHPLNNVALFGDAHHSDGSGKGNDTGSATIHKAFEKESDDKSHEPSWGNLNEIQIARMAEQVMDAWLFAVSPYLDGSPGLSLKAAEEGGAFGGRNFLFAEDGQVVQKPKTVVVISGGGLKGTEGKSEALLQMEREYMGERNQLGSFAPFAALSNSSLVSSPPPSSPPPSSLTPSSLFLLQTRLSRLLLTSLDLLRMWGRASVSSVDNGRGAKQLLDGRTKPSAPL
mmetsp:Transcript_16101/g.28975  ORF Transcript_16101/g.28975 Transcript_16101/m.28975 type:complete len:540 (-) Transcript_16101:1625-3244(-)